MCSSDLSRCSGIGVGDRDRKVAGRRDGGLEGERRRGEELRRQWTGPGHLLICLDGHANPAISGPHGGLVHSRHFETRYSHRQTADDLILSLIAGEKRPVRLVIVSGDSDITVEARRKGCAIAGCVDWYASLTETGPASIPSRTIEDRKSTRLNSSH